MERFRIWTLVFLLAIVDFGHIGLGFAQTQEDDSISSASDGRAHSRSCDAETGRV